MFIIFFSVQEILMLMGLILMPTLTKMKFNLRGIAEKVKIGSSYLSAN